eukprot:CAMPEP_0175985260 /NCGR_PEP_ID=MMETSP0108-20121206/49464_1 /TAXON_ID=195067 ORGANISM="Goniomonas pacifica, Strain CCMP1869" /NCGR_SAMPLE_ID=MMETSP0108 /ASSEMBLY_ACC=CAM_ASM_000204 /LENGTH=49 /DNA_ID= /DNA_START= /DNA_END= /DNA_ORIENTATION=
MIDFFLRVLNTLDEEVICQDFPRSPADSAVAMKIKDAIRERCLGTLVDA